MSSEILYINEEESVRKDAAPDGNGKHFAANLIFCGLEKATKGSCFEGLQKKGLQKILEWTAGNGSQKDKTGSDLSFVLDDFGQ